MSTQKKCDQCGKLHNRRRFCCNKCKDLFHNLHNPRGMYAHLKGHKIVKTSEDYNDGYEGMEMGWDGHKESI